MLSFGSFLYQDKDYSAVIHRRDQ